MRATPGLSVRDGWDSERWQGAAVLDVSSFHERSTEHRPMTQARMAWDDAGVYGIFRVEDRFVRAASVGRQIRVCGDSCVEWFVQPTGSEGHFNFEFNCGGSLLTRYNVLQRAERTLIAEQWLDQMQIAASMPKRVEPEISEPTTWTLAFFVPFGLFGAYLGDDFAVPQRGDVWRANWFKCGDDTSHPHWGSWAPIGETLNFHQPDRFGEMAFC